MGVYNPNMKMPENCDQCPISNCSLDNGWLDYPTRPLGCPLIYVPEHGRLIDADALLEDKNDEFVHKTMIFGGQYVYTESVIRNAPTVIVARRGIKHE